MFKDSSSGAGAVGALFRDMAEKHTPFVFTRTKVAKKCCEWKQDCSKPAENQTVLSSGT